MPGQTRLFKLLTSEFHDAARAYRLFDEFLRHQAHNKSFCLKLITVAKQKTGVPWYIRRLATLMLEHQMLKLRPDDLDGFDFLLVQLNLKQAPGIDKELVRSVLKEGYSSTDIRHFIPEFRRKLERLSRVHEKIKGRRTSNAALRDFIQLSRQHCKLALARYLFTPEEIVDEILSQLQVTDGVRDLDISQAPFIENEITQATSLLPDFEAEILKRLCQTSRIYWVSEKTSSEINSLVEYPLTTVVLVIKPPGSDIEFEVKRAGCKGGNSLNVVYARDGYTVPPSHRLDGGSMQWLLRYEAHAATKLGLIYRLVHGTEAPIANYISRSTIYAIPGRHAEVRTMNYFTEPQSFGERFDEMRVAMKESVSAFAAEGHVTLPDLPTGLGLTGQFIGQVAPAQAILSGTSSFRLDRLDAYLSSVGPDQYFKEGLQVAYSRDDARQLADNILEEVLGVYEPPDVRYESYEEYVGAALSVAANRARADRVYLALMEQIAKFWGTLLGVRAHTRGESFVARNVGLKSFWESGQWKVRIIFMDHDAVTIPGPSESYFYADSGIPTMALDESYIWGRSPRHFANSEVGYLQRIYRIGHDLDRKGESLARRTLKEAYGKTRQALLTNQQVRSLFHKQFLERLLDWDTFVGGYLRMNDHKSANTRWKKKMKNMLDVKGYRNGAVEKLSEIVEKNREFLQKYSFLFQPR
ncbi:MAG: hypothetical protein ACREVH_06035 [Gammaproteobacteria bacterium]